MFPESTEFSDLASKTKQGDHKARERLFGLVQAELHRIASRFVSPGQERFQVEHDMLVDDAFMRLTKPYFHWTTLSEFCDYAAVTMRHLLIDSQRRQSRFAVKHLFDATLDEPSEEPQADAETIPSQFSGFDLIDLDDLIETLWATHPECAQVLDVRLLLGHDIKTTAEVLKLTQSTVRRRWETAKQFVRDAITSDELRVIARPPQTRRIPIQLTIDKDFAEFTNNDERILVNGLADLLDYGDTIHVLTRRPGSTQVVVALPREQAEQLLWLFERGVLDSLGATGAKVIGHSVAIALMTERESRNSFDVFLCHNSDDKAEVKRIAIKLRARGVLPWLDEWELRPGHPWQEVLESQISGIQSVAVFVGNSRIGPWQNMELNAFIREFVSRKCPVIPVILKTCETPPTLPVFLNGMTWVDFSRRSPNPYDQLIWGITGRKRN